MLVSPNELMTGFGLVCLMFVFLMTATCPVLHQLLLVIGQTMGRQCCEFVVNYFT